MSLTLQEVSGRRQEHLRNKYCKPKTAGRKTRWWLRACWMVSKCR